MKVEYLSTPQFTVRINGQLYVFDGKSKRVQDIRASDAQKILELKINGKALFASVQEPVNFAPQAVSSVVEAPLAILVSEELAEPVVEAPAKRKRKQDVQL